MSLQNVANEGSEEQGFYAVMHWLIGELVPLYLKGSDMTPVMNMKESLCMFTAVVLKCNSIIFVIFNEGWG